uniref:Uncharacterized protein n=1 Tax=Manihot esculenta TaxID=3983 RepID=A0A2C9W4X2_MANES
MLLIECYLPSPIFALLTIRTSVTLLMEPPSLHWIKHA